MNVKTAFLHEEIEKKVYIEALKDFAEKFKKILKLNKIFYELKQSSYV